VGEKQKNFGETSRAVSGKRRKLKISHIFLLLLLIAAATFTLYRLNLKRKLRSRIEAIRAAGYPVTCEELDKWYSIPEGVENAAYFILDAVEYYVEPKDIKLLPLLGKAELPARNIPLTEETKSVIARYLNDNQKTLELLHEAATLEHSRYPIDLTLGNEIHLDHFSDLRRGYFLLCLQAVLHCENEEPQLAICSVLSALAIANSLSNEPIIISQRAHASQYTYTISILERLINRLDFHDEQLVEISKTLDNPRNLPGMTRAFAGHRCFILDAFENLTILNDDMFGDNIPPKPILEVYKALGFADIDLITCLDIINKYIEAEKLPLHKRMDVTKNIIHKLENISCFHIGLRSFNLDLSRYISTELRNIAELKTAQAAIAVQRYRLAKDELPDQLKDLVPDYLDSVPTDPFDGKELRYKKLETGFVVYSIGENLSDDGGIGMPQTIKERRKIRNWDITFIIAPGTPHGEH